MLVSVEVIGHIYKITHKWYLLLFSLGNNTFLIDLKNHSPEHGGHSSEDDQESFRPSSSPLSHSSPSEISGTSLSG